MVLENGTKKVWASQKANSTVCCIFKANREVFKKVKSLRYFRGKYGKHSGSNNQIWFFEFENLTALETMWQRASKDEQFLAIDKEFMDNIEYGTLEVHIWQNCNRDFGIE
jgi:hypothetical protein